MRQLWREANPQTPEQLPLLVSDSLSHQVIEQQTALYDVLPCEGESMSCEAGLIPNIYRESNSALINVAFVTSINESNWTEAVKTIKASGNVDLLDLLKAGGDKSYSDLEKNKRTYLANQSYNLAEKHSTEILRQVVPDEARKEQ